MRLVVSSLGRALPAACSALLVVCAGAVLFAILGMQLFMDSFGACTVINGEIHGEVNGEIYGEINSEVNGEITSEIVGMQLFMDSFGACTVMG